MLLCYYADIFVHEAFTSKSHISRPWIYLRFTDSSQQCLYRSTFFETILARVTACYYSANFFQYLLKLAMSKKQYEPTPRAADIYRTQMALNSVLQSDASAFRRDVRVDEGCSELLVDYTIGLAEHLLGEAAKVAKHRGKDKIEPVDLNLTLVKKLGMKMNSPDLSMPRLVLHREALGSGYGSMLHARPQNVMVTADEGLQHFKHSAAAKKAGQKRKHE